MAMSSTRDSLPSNIDQSEESSGDEKACTTPEGDSTSLGSAVGTSRQTSVGSECDEEPISTLRSRRTPKVQPENKVPTSAINDSQREPKWAARWKSLRAIMCLWSFAPVLII